MERLSSPSKSFRNAWLVLASGFVLLAPSLQGQFVYVANGGGSTVSVFGSDGSPKAPLHGLLLPSALAFDSRGNMYLGDIIGKRVQKFALRLPAK